MRYLLDTMVVCEPARPAPNAGATAWLAEQGSHDLAVSVLTFGEIQRGVARMPNGRRRKALATWLANELAAQFDDRVLPVDLEVTLVWGELTAEGDRAGRPLPVMDGLLLATARVHGLTLVTRNVDDARDRGVPTLNPYR